MFDLKYWMCAIITWRCHFVKQIKQPDERLFVYFFLFFIYCLLYYLPKSPKFLHFFNFCKSFLERWVPVTLFIPMVAFAKCAGFLLTVFGCLGNPILFLETAVSPDISDGLQQRRLFMFSFPLAGVSRSQFLDVSSLNHVFDS